MTESYFITTFSEKQIHFKEMSSRDIDINDIAHALSNLCRFGGHCHTFYSVAEHAIGTAALLRREGYSAHVQFAGLHHDDQESYICDLPTPLKKMLPEYGHLEDKVEAAIHECFKIKLTKKEKQVVKWADKWMCWFEKEKLLGQAVWTDFKKRLGRKPKKTKTLNDLEKEAKELLWVISSFPKWKSSPDNIFGDMKIAYLAAHLTLNKERKKNGR